ncbi:MAG: DNA polymerase Y family protein [Acidimicrobiales bacterium]|nr:DNA polymerase Y family protein [Acidimicrobiales bacterium]
MPVRTMVVWCHDWPVAAAGCTPDQPVAVVYANRVIACSHAARRHGVQRGQRRREAQARCPDVMIVEHDVSRDARAFEPVLQAVESFTPRIELSQPGTCAFATRGPSRYFGGDQQLAHAVTSRVDAVLAARGWAGHVAVGVADGPFAARLAARCEPPVIVEPGRTPEFLAPLPVAVLERPELCDVLERLGLRTLGQFAALDPADVVARFGLEGAIAHRLAAGCDERPPEMVDPPADLVVEAELDPPAERVDTAAFLAKVLADELFCRLDSLALSCTRVAIYAETEHGESVERLWRHEGGLSSGALTDRVRWQLDGWINGSPARRPTSGITLLRLWADEVVPATGRQLGFWGVQTAAAERAVRAVARVQGLLGPEAVRVPEWVGGRGPADQIRLVPANAVDLTESRPAASADWVTAPWPGRIPPPSPAVVYPRLLPAEVIDDQGALVRVTGRAMVTNPPVRVSIDGQPFREIQAWAGPWPYDERWWDRMSRRRRARFQMVVAGTGAHLFCVEGGRWWVEASYD